MPEEILALNEQAAGRHPVDHAGDEAALGRLATIARKQAAALEAVRLRLQSARHLKARERPSERR